MLDSFFLLIGTTFGALAAAIAFLITYIEYRHHAYTTRRLWRESLTVALFTFVLFFAISALIGYVLG